MRRAASVLLLLLVMGVAVALLVSGRLYVVRSSSMMPSIRAGDAILVRGPDGSSRVGEVVLFEMQGQLITHRVVEVRSEGLVTKGDANVEPDPWLVDEDEVRGRVILRLPYAGWLLAFLRQPGGWLLLVVLPAVAFVFVYGRRTWRSYRGWRAEAGAGELDQRATGRTFASDAFVYRPRKDRRWWRRLTPPRSLGVIGVLVVISIPGLTARGSLGFFSATHSGAVEISTALPQLSAFVDIKPEVLQLQSHGDHVTAFIGLPEGYIAGIDVSTVRLCVGTSSCGGAGIGAGDPIWTHGGRILKVTFDREGVIALVASVAPPADVTLTVSGLVDGALFAGSDVVRVIGCGFDDPSPSPSPDPAVSSSDSPDASPSASPSDSPEPEPTPASSHQTPG
jgi:signal peptidase